MGRLTDRDFWNKRYQGSFKDEKAAEVRQGLRGFFDRTRLRAGAKPGDAYYSYLLNRTYSTELPYNEDWKVIEIGCAPGRSLLNFARTFGYQPYGVEYTPNGVEVTRAYFEENHVDPANVIDADFFSEEFLSKHESQFDVVLSGGFIEHFDDPEQVIACHARLLKTGGFLVCSIPNLKSYSYPLFKLFSPDILEAHNLSIMRLEPYKALFANQPLKLRACRYVGTFDLVAVGSMQHSESATARFVAGLADKFADVMNHLCFLLLRGRAFESAMSPMLIYIGTRTDTQQTDG